MFQSSNPSKFTQPGGVGISLSFKEELFYTRLILLFWAFHKKGITVTEQLTVDLNSSL